MKKKAVKHIDGRGLFIVFEGIDGSGKSTQAAMLRDTLAARGVNVVLTREPTDGPWGRRIRKIASEGRAGTSLEDEIDWFVRDRKQHVEKLILPSLKKGRVVISDRYYYSTIAYQGALGANPATLRALNEKVHGFPKPDVVFYVRISPRTGIARINTKRDGANAGYERAGYLEKVRKIFDSFDDGNFVRIAGGRGAEAIAADIAGRVATLLGLPNL